MEKNKSESLNINKSVICYRNNFNKKQIDEIFRTIIALFKFNFPELFSWIPKKVNSTIWKSQKFQNSIIKARKVSKKKFGKIYDTLQSTTALKSMMTSDRILSIVEKYINEKRENLIAFNSIVRFDPPFDDRNSVDWHYDLYPNSGLKVDPINGVSVTVAFHDTKISHGAPIFLINSHIKNIPLIVKKNKKNHSETYSIDNKYINAFKRKSFESKKGDILIFPMKMIHKSGKNISNRVRISGLFRYYPTNKKEFIALKERYTPVK